jgi:hypothetical protein
MGRQLGAVLVVALVLLAGCSDGDDDGGDGAVVASETTGSGASTTLPTASTAAGAASTATGAATVTTLGVDAKISTTGLGAVLIGAQADAAAEAAGTVFAEQGAPVGASACHYVTATGLDGARFMVSDGLIVRVDIDSGPIETLSGARIGSTKDEIIGLFGEKIAAEPHPTDPAGELLVFVPADVAEADRRVVFETDGSGTVVRYRTGRLPEVLYVDGCTDAAA